MFLPDKYQPETRSQWSMLAPTDSGEKGEEAATAVEEKYFSENEKTFYNFDPIFMGDFNDYKFKLKMNDEEEHNFFVTVEQDLIPRKCI